MRVRDHTHEYWEQLLWPLFRCQDCNGRGKREHAIWPKMELVVSDTAELTNEVSVAYEPPSKAFKTCATCRGSGRR